MERDLTRAWEAAFQRCVDFHGHACPGLALGYKAAKAGMEWLGERRSEDEEIVAIVETDACGSDAVQVVTGCTFGKGNFFFKDYGKTAFSFLSRATGKGVRLALRPDAFALTPEHQALFRKVGQGTASEEEKEMFGRLHIKRTLDVLAGSVLGMYQMREVTVPLPPRARVVNSTICSRCGEPVMATKIVETERGLLCFSCREGAGFAG